MNDMVVMETKNRDLHIMKLENRIDDLIIENGNIRNQINYINQDRTEKVVQLKEKQEQINQLHMEIQGLKGLIFPENTNVEKFSFKLFGHKLKLYKVK